MDLVVVQNFKGKCTCAFEKNEISTKADCFGDAFIMHRTFLVTIKNGEKLSLTTNERVTLSLTKSAMIL